MKRNFQKLIHPSIPRRRFRPQLSTSANAFAFLITTRVFTGAVVGAGARRSDHARAFQTLMDEPEAKEIFLDLFQRGNEVAKLYGLCGLQLLEDSKAFRQRIEPFSNSKTEIWSEYGCLKYKCDLGTEIPRILSGQTPRSLYPQCPQKPAP